MKREIKSPADKHDLTERIDKLPYSAGWVVTITKEPKNDTGRKTKRTV